VDWSETNAALGQAVMLLDTIAKRTAGFQFTQSELMPRGSFSRIRALGNGTSSTTYELFGSSDISLGKLLWYRRFDSGMVRFLQCLNEYGQWAESHQQSAGPASSKVLQYPIVDDCIMGISVKLHFNPEARWTKALKFMLINLKYAVAWSAKQEQALI
jgi:beclin